jgi:hypothetical protein
MTEAQKQQILEAVEHAAVGLITGGELIGKLEAITESKFETEVA